MRTGPLDRAPELAERANSPRPTWSIVIPCYRSGEWTDELVLRIENALGTRADRVELILVDDASPDDVTWRAIEAAARKHKWIHGLGLQFNVGQFRAIMAGMAQARGEWVVTMDDDLQTPPEELRVLFEASEAHPEMDAIIGRYAQKQHAPWRNLGTRLVSFLLVRIYGKPRHLETTSFRILKRPLVETLLAYSTRAPVLSTLILRSTRRLMNVDVEHRPRPRGRGGYRLTTLVDLVMAKIFSGSTFPLRAVSLMGLLISFSSVAFGGFTLVKWMTGLVVEPGFTTLVLLITSLCGLTLLSIGVIGEYLVRVVEEVSGAPRYVVRSRTGPVEPPGRQEATGGLAREEGGNAL